MQPNATCFMSSALSGRAPGSNVARSSRGTLPTLSSTRVAWRPARGGWNSAEPRSNAAGTTPEWEAGSVSST